jgi:hypothetical protein
MGKSLLICMLAMFSASACTEVKEAGRTVGHTTRDVTTAIGHGTRDVVKDIGHGTRRVVTEATDDKEQP